MQRLKSDFIIDKRFLAINFDVINFLQSALFTPKPVNIIALKRGLGISETAAEQLKNLHPNSPFYKYLYAIMLAEVSACMILQQESFQAFILNLASKKEDKIIIDIETLRYESMTLRERLERYNELVIDAAQKLSLRQLTTPIKYFILDLHKAQTLLSYAPYIHDEEMADFVRNSVDRTYRRIRNNLEYFDRQRNRSDLTPDERERVDEGESRYLRHLELNSVENIQKHAPHINLDDPVMFMQHVRSREVLEEFYENDQQKERMVSSSYDQVTGVLVSDQPKYILQGNPLSKPETQQLSLKYSDLQNRLNDEFGKILDRKDIILAGVDVFSDLQDRIHGILKGVGINEAHFKAADEAALNYLQRLVNSRNTGCDFHILPGFPDNKDKKYDNSYIFLEDTSKLLYHQNGQANFISVDDMEKFKQLLYQFLNGRKQAHLTNEQVDRLIPINQGHIRYVHYSDLINYLTEWARVNRLLEKQPDEAVNKTEVVNKVLEEERQADEKPTLDNVTGVRDRPLQLNNENKNAIQKVKDLIELSMQDPDSAKAADDLSKLIELINNELLNGKDENFTTTFNQLVATYEKLPHLNEIYLELKQISFISNEITIPKSSGRDISLDF